MERVKQQLKKVGIGEKEESVIYKGERSKRGEVEAGGAESEKGKEYSHQDGNGFGWKIPIHQWEKLMIPHEEAERRR